MVCSRCLTCSPEMGFTKFRRKRIYLRVSEYEYDQIKLKASAVGLGLSEYLRRCGIESRLPHHKLEPEVLQLCEQLRELASTISKTLASALNNNDDNSVQITQELVGEIQKITGGLL